MSKDAALRIATHRATVCNPPDNSVLELDDGRPVFVGDTRCRVDFEDRCFDILSIPVSLPENIHRTEVQIKGSYSLNCNATDALGNVVGVQGMEGPTIGPVSSELLVLFWLGEALLVDGEDTASIDPGTVFGVRINKGREVSSTSFQSVHDSFGSFADDDIFSLAMPKLSCNTRERWKFLR